MHIVLRALCCALLSTAAGTAAADRLSGTVVDDATGLPIAGADVAVYGIGPAPPGGDHVSIGIDHVAEAHATTAADGTFDQQFDAGYWVQALVRHPGYAAKASNALLYLFPGGSHVIEVRMQRAGSLRVRVVDAQSGAPVAGARVRTTLLPDHHRDTDADGVALFDDLLGAHPVCVVHAPRHLNTCLGGHALGFFGATLGGDEVDVAAGALRDVELAVGVGGTLAGRAEDVYGGQPLANEAIELRVHAANGDVLRSGSVVTGADGRYAWEGLPPGDYRVSARPRSTARFFIEQVHPQMHCMRYPCDYAGGAPVHVDAASVTEDVDFAFAPRSHIRGQVRAEESGASLADVEVIAYRRVGDGWVEWNTTRTDATGRYGFDYAPTSASIRTRNTLGRIDLAWPNERCGACDPQDTLWLRTGETREQVDFELERGPRLVGDVRMEGGAPWSEARVTIYDADLAEVWSTFVDWSYFRSPGLPPGTYYVRAVSGRYGTCVVHAAAPCVGDDNAVDRATATAVTIGGIQDTEIALQLRYRVAHRAGFEDDDGR